MQHSHEFASKAEKQAAPIIAAMGGRPYTNFEPPELKYYLDSAGAVYKAKPDFIIKNTAIELKDGSLNSQYTRAESHQALCSAYFDAFNRIPDKLTYNEICVALYNVGPGTQARLALLENGFNQSVWKQAAVQARIGWQRFLIVFSRTPSKKDADRYIDAGLIFCTLETLPEMLRTIELCQYGIYIPFVFYSKRAKYGFTVTPDHTTRGQTMEYAEASDRKKFLSCVDASKKASLEINF